MSDIEENVQVTENYATSFEKSNVEDLTKKLEDCLRGKDRYNSEVLQNYILTKYNWNDVVLKTEKIYKKEF